MNKTIIININGIVFHIEEDAYEVLRSYMTDVKRHFAYTADSEEIVSDIENRIAEMFLERLEKEKKQVVVLQDVQEVTAQMGSVSDFDPEDDEAPLINENIKADKKLFRDTDDRIIGGVCSGIGHYFDIETRWIRVIAFLLILTAGSGFVIYAILWIVMPKATTRADKMAMKGEQPNLQNFKKNFDEEVEAVHKNISRLHKDAEPGLSMIENFFRELFQFLGKVVKGIVKVIGFLIILEGTIILLGLIIGLFVLLGWSDTYLDFLPFKAIDPDYRSVLYFSIFIIAAIPITALVLFAIRVFFNRRIITRTGSFIMLIIWIFGVCMGAYYGTKVGSQFREEAGFSETVDIKPSSVFYLKLNDTKFLTSEDSIEYDIQLSSMNGRFSKQMDLSTHEDSVKSSTQIKRLSRGIILDNRDGNFNHLNRMALYIERSDVDKPTLVKTFTAQGPDFETGLITAQRINYRFEQIDSILLFDRRVHLSKDELWRNQEVKLTLRIPRNTRLVIDSDLDWYLRGVNLWDCHPEGQSRDLPTYWKMNAEGLTCDTLVSK